MPCVCVCVCVCVDSHCHTVDRVVRYTKCVCVCVDGHCHTADRVVRYTKCVCVCVCVCVSVDSHCHTVDRVVRYTNRGNVITLTRRASGDCSHDRELLGSLNSAQVLVHLQIHQSRNAVKVDQFGVGGIYGERLNLPLRFHRVLYQRCANPRQRVV
jgi:hypothetical protein